MEGASEGPTWTLRRSPWYPGEWAFEEPHGGEVCVRLYEEDGLFHGFVPFYDGTPGRPEFGEKGAFGTLKEAQDACNAYLASVWG
jgi:hypothetical protein